MNFTGHDLVKLRLPLIAAILLLATGLLLAWWSFADVRQAEQERDAAARRKDLIAQRLQQVRSEEREIKERTQLFQQWQTTGLIGEEKRLEWTEMLRAIQQELRIPGMIYEFGVQAPLEKVQGTAYAWFASPMHLQLQLLHEGDLLDFLSRVEKKAQALVLIRECTLSRAPKVDEPRTTTAQLKADCDLQWLTVRRSTGKS